jgi:hypothetical protein
MSRLKCTYREFFRILRDHGFDPIRYESARLNRFRGEYGGRVRLVDITPLDLGDEIPASTLESMIRQSGLPKSLFRK